MCACGAPRFANFHHHAIIVRDHPYGEGTETDTIDQYLCADHLDNWVEVAWPAMVESGDWHEIESVVTELR